jgi:RecB family endonuclease NucS
MNRIFLLFGCIILLTTASYSQKPKPQRTTLGSAGSSTASRSNSSGIYLIQSVGQASVIGTFQSGKTAVRQGFVQPPDKIRIQKISQELQLHVYPNPVGDELTIQFKEEVSERPSVRFYNAQGQVVQSEEADISQEHKTNVALLHPGFYILEIRMSNKISRLKLIKK